MTAVPGLLDAGRDSPVRWPAGMAPASGGVGPWACHTRLGARRPHFHGSAEVMVALRGVGACQGTGRPGLLVPGTVFLANPGEVHGVEALPGAGCWVAVLHLPPTMVPQRRPGDPAWLASGVREDADLATLALSACDAVARRAPRLEAEAALSALLLRLARGAMRHNPRPMVPAAVARARDYLHADPAADISLADLAAVAGHSPSHLVRSFRRSVGLTPLAYLARLRVVAAQDLLGRGATPAAAAAATGFSDQSHLTRWFRAVLGVTPAAYRRTIFPG